MRKPYDFYADNYQPILFKDLFDAAGRLISKDNTPVALVNESGYVMMTDAIQKIPLIHLCFRDQSVVLKSNCVQQIPVCFIESSHIYFSHLKYTPENKFSVHLDYLKFLNEMVKNAYKAAQIIFQYVKTHLFARSYGKTPLSKLEVVQSDFSEVIILFETFELALCKMQNLEQVIFLLDKLVDLLIILSRLSGARAVLQNNAMELLVNLKIFQKYIA